MPRESEIFLRKVDYMESRFQVNYENTPFLQTSKTAAHPNRLNWRAEILLSKNQKAIKGKTILDLASHDGRFSWACLELGASYVTGVEGRDYLVQVATKNLTGLGCEPDRFSFIQGDVFDYLREVKPGEFDTILCFGLFYHIVEHNQLLAMIRRIQPAYFILDTSIARGTFIMSQRSFKYTDQGPYFKILIEWLVQILRTPRGWAEKARTPINEEPCLVFRRESHEVEAATIDPTDLVAWPTKTCIELLLETYGFSSKQLHWNKKEIKDWTAIMDYKTGNRVSYIARTR